MIRTVSILALAAGCVAIAAASSLAADVTLKANARDGQIRRVQVALEVNGHVLQEAKDQTKQIPIRVEGSLAYHERLVREGEQLTAVRYYDKALAKMNIDGTPLEPKLRDDRRRIVVRSQESRLLMFSPEGTLRREELDMLDLQGSTLSLDALLPGGTAETGKKWKAPDAALAALLTLDKLTLNSSECELEKVEAGVAHIAIRGNVGGSIDGSLTEIVLDGTLGFDVQERQVAWLVLNVNETRMAGPAGPGVSVSGKLRVTLSPLASSDQLSDAALEEISLEPAAPLTLLMLEASDGRFRSWHDRRWHVIDERERTTVLRMIEDGARIAQCNITTADPPQDTASKMTLAKFRTEVGKSLEKFDTKIIASQEYTGRADHRVFGVQCQGKVSGVEIAWHYYHVINTKTRHRATLVVTLEANQADALGRTDLMLARSMQLLEEKKEVAKKDSETKKE